MRTGSGNIIPIVQKLSIFYNVKSGYMFVDLIRKAEHFNLYEETENKIPWEDVMVFTIND